MASTTERIQTSAERNRLLLSILSETDYALPALQQHESYLGDLERQRKDATKWVEGVDKMRKKELKEHKKYRDSVMKRFAYKVSGNKDKFEEKAAKEEREYFDVLQEEHKAKEQVQSLEALYEEAMAYKTELHGIMSRHSSAQHDLDTLYDAIFDGPTPEFPEEDSMERAAKEALQAYHDTKVRVEVELEVIKTLSAVVRHLDEALYHIEDALDHSRMDMFGGGTISDMMERNALHKAELSTQEAQRLMKQAQRQSKRQVTRMLPVHIAHGSILSDVVFDNIFTDMAFHDKIKASRAEVQRCRLDADCQLADARSRYQQLDQAVQEKAQGLETARSELQHTRELIFGQATAAASGSDQRGTTSP
ncbi:uncharacterized protein PG998_000944 [Apiospora kogelbergensis]|uniref:uncharacterized protein n=1 Tax=Apiospora kogelbergensis TaxID=1337665 RepID=UPI003130894F